MDMKKLINILDGFTYGRVIMTYDLDKGNNTLEMEINDDIFDHALIKEEENIQETLILGDRAEIKIATYHIKDFKFNDEGDYIHTLTITTDVGIITLRYYVQ